MTQSNQTYKSPQALEMAVKAAAKASPQDTGRAIQGFWFHRLLCRVFREPDSGFVLKGGRGMLARTVDARATRDIDLLAQNSTLDDAVKELQRLASQDLGDFVTFAFEGARTIKADDEYRSGMRLIFTPLLGRKRMQPISIDLVVDEVPLAIVERIAPADRIEVRGIETCDYVVYPVEAALPDKLCGIIERHDDRPSSRVKDLVDIVVYAMTADVNGSELQKRLRRELGARKLTLPQKFAVPEEWRSTHERAYVRLFIQTGISSEWSSIDEAVNLAGRLFNPALEGETDGFTWNHLILAWEREEGPIS